MFNSHAAANNRIVRRTILAVLAGMLGLAGSAAANEGPGTIRHPFEWRGLPPLPDQVGFAGPYVGTHNQALLVGGGANFAQGYPWEGGRKLWHDQIFVLEKGAGEWRSGFSLPRPLGYGIALTTNRGVLCIGGDDAQRMHDDVFLLRWTGAEIEVQELAPLPQPLAYAAGALVGEVVYVAGGLAVPEGQAEAALRIFWSLDLSKEQPEWRELEPWPGPERFLATAASLDGSFYLAGGARRIEKNGARQREYLTDAYRYREGEGWERLADLPRPAVAAATPAPTAGRTHFFVVGGDDGSKVGFEPMSEHPGFPKNVLAYHSITNTWVSAGDIPFTSPVTLPAVMWNGEWIFASGETRPGVRTMEVWAARPIVRQAQFGTFNYVMLVLYLVALVAMAVYFSRGQGDTDKFFLAGRRIPWWAAGLSIFGTQLSAITFIAIPALVYATDWTYVLANVAIVLIAPVVVFCYLPFYRRVNITTVYEYLETRFNIWVRLFGSAAFTLLQLGRMGIVLFIPALALATVTGMPVLLAILLMGLLATLYTVLGGIEAVIWTDVLQVIVLMGGAILCLVTIFGAIPGGFSGFLEVGLADHKFRAFNWTWDATVAAVWVVLLGNLLSTLVPYSADQTVVQRYLVTASEKQAARSIWTNAVITIPATLIFFMLGTALYVFYKTNPHFQVPGIEGDAVFPLFIAESLPAGVAGVVIAGVFAAAMSSLDSSMNSVAASLTTDYRRFRPKIEEKNALRMARYLTLALGVFGTGTAVLLALGDVRFIWDAYIRLLGLFGGSLAGLFALAIFTKRASGAGALIGAVCSVFVLYLFQSRTNAHPFLYAGVGIVSCFAIGYAASLILPRKQSGEKIPTAYEMLKDTRSS